MSFEADWKKNKAKTLLKDPLSDPLKALDQALVKLEKCGPTKTTTELAAVSGAAAVAKAAAGKTIELCNKTIHAATIRYLTQLESTLKKMIEDVKVKQRAYAALVTELQKKRKNVSDLLEDVVAKPSVPQIAVTSKAVKEFLEWFRVNNDPDVSGRETEDTSRDVAATIPMLEDFKKCIAQGNEKGKQQLLGDFKAQIKKINSPGYIKPRLDLRGR